MSKKRWREYITIIVGAWLIISPIFVTFTAPLVSIDIATTTASSLVTWNFAIIGLLAVALGAASITI
jgi:hypothetical protein